MSAIVSVATAVPEHRLDARQALSRLRQFWPQLDKLEDADAGLGTRFLCEPVERLLEPRSLGDVQAAYLRHARRLATASARDALARAGVAADEIDLVISVSCTGYVVPSLDVYLAAELGFRADVLRVPITELGCSGGSAAIALAHRHLIAFPHDRVLVVAVELPSLNFQRGDSSPDNLTASLVFGDGAGCAVMGAPKAGRRHLEVVGTSSYLIGGTERFLGFDLRDGGFHVVLDRRLPRVLARELRPIVDGFLADFELRPSFYAVHAAGPRIFSAVESALSLPANALDVSRQVFAEVGNTSSAAILFALDKVIASPEAASGQGLGIGIGPGISVELMHLAWAGTVVPKETSASASRSRSVP